MKLPLVLLILLCFSGREPVDPAGANPLERLDRVVGGEWHSEDPFVHAFEWGVAKKVLHGRTWLQQDGERTLVSEGWWFWHPVQKQVVGFGVADGLPFDFMELTGRFEDDRFVQSLKGTSAAGHAMEFTEIWEFAGDDRYLWTLLTETTNGPKPVMEGRYQRRIVQPAYR